MTFLNNYLYFLPLRFSKNSWTSKKVFELLEIDLKSRIISEEIAVLDQKNGPNLNNLFLSSMKIKKKFSKSRLNEELLIKEKFFNTIPYL